MHAATGQVVKFSYTMKNLLLQCIEGEKFYFLNGSIRLKILILSCACFTAEGAISSLIKRIQSPSTFFYVPSHRLLFNDTTPEDKLLPAPSKEDSHSRSSSSKTMINSATANYKKQLGFNCNATSVSAPLLVSILESASPVDKDKDESSLPYAPILTVSEPLTGPCVRISLSVDVLGFLRPSLPLFEVATVLKEAIAAQLSYAAEAITWEVQSL